MVFVISRTKSSQSWLFCKTIDIIQFNFSEINYIIWRITLQWICNVKNDLEGKKKRILLKLHTGHFAITIRLLEQQTCATTATASVAAVLSVMVGSSRNHAGPHVARSGPQRSPPLVTGVSITVAVSTNSTSGLTGHTGPADHWAVTTRTLTQLLPLPILHSGAVTSLFPPQTWQQALCFGNNTTDIVKPNIKQVFMNLPIVRFWKSVSHCYTEY